jgi:ABC-type thiamine transport system ATPase subunit
MQLVSLLAGKRQHVAITLSGRPLECCLLPSCPPFSAAGELQRVAITLCLGQPANVYLVDEPSAYLDSEQRILAAKVIKR